MVGGVWSYKPGVEMLTLARCLRALVQCAGGEGNLLLNTGPLPDGRIEPHQAERLPEVGDWLRQHGESVYGTRGGPLRPGPWGSALAAVTLVYLDLWDWKDGAIRLPPLPGPVLDYRRPGGDPPGRGRPGGCPPATAGRRLRRGGLDRGGRSA